MARDESTQQIPTNLRLLRLLEVIVRRGVSQKPAQLAVALDLAKPTVHRLLQTAEAEGYLQRDLDGRSFGPGPRLRDLAVNTMSSEHLRMARQAILQSVAEAVGETCNLATPDREGMVYLDRVETKWPLRIQLPVGTQVPFHCTASGKMYLATLRSRTLKAYLSAKTLLPQTDQTITDSAALREELRTIAARGYATDNEEFMDGMTAIAVPIPDAQGRMVATLSVHAPVQRLNLSGLERELDVLKTGAEELSKLLQSP